MSPDRLLLVVNPRSADSLTLANHYAFGRNVPPDNIMALSWDDAKTTADWSEFYDKIFKPVQTEAKQRKCLAVAFSSGFPISVDISKTFTVDEKDMPENVKKVMVSSGSLTGMMYLGPLLEQVGSAPWNLSVLMRNYYIYLHGIPLLPTLDEERLWKTEPFSESLLSKHLPCVCLGVKTPAYTTDQAVENLKRSIEADGTFPQGTVYFMVNSDIRSKTRQAEFDRAVESLARIALQKKYENLQGKKESGGLPQGKTDIIGLVAGSAVLDWPKSNSRFVPGAFGEHLTSYGGSLFNTCGQTPLTAFLLAGAAGSSGTVTEPYAIAAKFPSCSLQVHYISGLTQIEAYYHAIRWPYQLLYVGDPLCRPWFPKQEIVSRSYRIGNPPPIQILSPEEKNADLSEKTRAIQFGQTLELKIGPLPKETGAIRVLHGSRAILEQPVNSDFATLSISTRQLGCGPILLRIVGLDSTGNMVFQNALELSLISIK